MSGLSDGEQVIVANQSSFQPGETVTPKPSSGISTAGGR